jgi:transposase
MFNRSRKPTFIDKFDALVKKKGFSSISEFVDDWISKGGTFRTIFDLTTLNGIHVRRYTVWLNLREYLTIPYGEGEAFWYKWDALARTKGKDTLIDWLDTCGKNLTTLEISRELGVGIRTIEKLNERINEIRNIETKKFRKSTDSDGFCMTNAKEKWLKIVRELGHTTFRDAIKDLDNKGMYIDEIAVMFNTSEGTIRRRLKRGNIVLSPKKRRKTDNIFQRVSKRMNAAKGERKECLT